ALMDFVLLLWTPPCRQRRADAGGSVQKYAAIQSDYRQDTGRTRPEKADRRTVIPPAAQQTCMPFYAGIRDSAAVSARALPSSRSEVRKPRMQSATYSI